MFNIKAATASRITLEVLDVNGKVRRSETFSNIMTNIGLLSWARGPLGTHIAIGSGARDELVTVTDLHSYGRSASGSYTYYDTNFIDEVNGVMRTTHRLTVVFPLESSPQNYSELGIHNNNINALQTYALIRDPQGDPTSIGVLAGEQVRAIYDVQYSLPLQYQLNKTIGGTPTLITVVPFQTGQTNAIRLPTTTASHSRFWPSGQGIPNAGTQPSGGSNSPVAGVVSQNQWSVNVGMNQSNLAGGISLMKYGAGAQVSVMAHFDPPVNKTASVNMVVRVLSSLKNGDFYG